MYQGITKLPTDELTRSEASQILYPMMIELETLGRSNPKTDYYYTTSAFAEVMSLGMYIDMLNYDLNKEQVDRVISIQYRNNTSNSLYIYKDQMYKNCLGIIVSITTRSLWEHDLEEQTKGRVELTGAAELLKLKPTHHLKIYHRPDNPNMLFVNSNKPIPMELFYKLKKLQNSLNKANLTNFNEYTSQLYDAFIDKNINQINGIMKEYLESDYVKEKKYNEFLEAMMVSVNIKQRRLKDKIARCYDQIEYYENAVANEAVKLRELTNELEIAEAGAVKDGYIKELFKYLNKHPHITDFRVYSPENYIEMTFKSPLVYYTDYAAEKMKKVYAKDSIENKILDLFIEKKFNLCATAKIRFYASNFRMEAINAGVIDSEIINHPHIDRFGCLGTHREGLREAAESGDYITAIEQINQATMNINFYDSCVAKWMIKTLAEQYLDKKTWIDTETKEMVTTIEAIRRSTNEEA